MNKLTKIKIIILLIGHSLASAQSTKSISWSAETGMRFNQFNTHTVTEETLNGTVFSPGFHAGSAISFEYKKVNFGVQYSWQKTNVPTKYMTILSPWGYKKFPNPSIDISWHQFGFLIGVPVNLSNKLQLVSGFSFEMQRNDIGHYLSQGWFEKGNGTIVSSKDTSLRIDYSIIAPYTARYIFLSSLGLKVLIEISERNSLYLSVPIYLGFMPILSTETFFDVKDQYDFIQKEITSGEGNGFGVLVGYKHFFKNKKERSQ